VSLGHARGGGKAAGSLRGSGSGTYASDATTLISDPRGSVVDERAGAKDMEIDGPAKKSPAERYSTAGSREKMVEKGEEGGEEETNYPGALGLFVLVTGIALSVFLISLDRTIITTVSNSLSCLAQSDFEKERLIQDRRFHSSRMSSSLMIILGGMVQPISSRRPLSSPCTDGYICCSI